METRPNIYEYLDYRAFLKQMYAFKKKTVIGFSYRTFARLAGFKSHNFLNLVMNGKRNLSPMAVHQFTKAFKLSKEESNFFEVLVYFSQASSAEEKNRYYERILQFKNYNDVKPLEASQYTYFSNWYFVALRELVTVDHFREDPLWINHHLGIRLQPEEIKRAIQTLLDLKLLARDSKNRLRQTVEKICTTPEMKGLPIINFHREMFKKASESLEYTAAENREISALTVAISRKQFERIKERLNQFRREIHAIASEPGSKEIVYQLGFQFFNLSKIPSSQSVEKKRQSRNKG